MKALVVDEPWISLVLCGAKTWEMRRRSCRHRGPVALVRKGSGQIVGVADVVDSLPQVETLEAYAASEPFHRIPEPEQGEAFARGWRIPWVIAGARRLASPVDYSHPPGAVIWVNLAPSVAERVVTQAELAQGPDPRRVPESINVSIFRSQRNSGVPTPSETAGVVRTVELTAANVNPKNNHIYLRKLLDFFPSDAVGGSNRLEAGRRSLRISFLPGSTVETDIDGDKKFLRARAAVGEFFRLSGARGGDMVRIERTAAYAYTFSLVPKEDSAS